MATDSQKDDANRTENLRLSWERDFAAYLESAKSTNPDRYAAISELAKAVQQDPQAAGAWWAFLRHEESTSPQSACPTPRQGTPRASVPTLCDLYRWAIRLVPRQDRNNRAAFVNLWLGYARQQWLKNSDDDARDTFKTLKSQQIGEEYAIMYAEWAGLEAISGNASKALSIVSKGIKTGAEPRGVLTKIKQDLEDGRYSYVPFYRLEGAEDPAATPRPSSAAPRAPQPQLTPASYVQLKAPPFSSSALKTETLSYTKPQSSAVSHGSVHTGSSSGRASTAAQHTPAGVASASLRTHSSAGTLSSEDATVSNLRSATQPLTQTITGHTNAAPVTQTLPLVAEQQPAHQVQLTMRQTSSVLKSSHTGPAADSAVSGAQEQPAPAAAEDAARRPRMLGLGRAMRVTAASAATTNNTSGPSGMDIDSAPSAAAPAPDSMMQTPAPALGGAGSSLGQFRTPQAAAPMSTQKTPAVSSALRSWQQHTPLAPLMEVSEATPMSAAPAVTPAAAAQHPPKQLVLEDGPAAAPEEATARVSGHRAFGSLAGIPEDPGATVPLSRSVLASAAASRAPAPTQQAATLDQQRMPPPPPVVQPRPPAAQQQQVAMPPPPQRQPLQQGPAPARPPSASSMPPPPPASSSGRRVIEDEESVTVRGITYTKLECVGRGGSSKVYKVMAPNKKIFALKRIRLSGCDAEAASGFLDEITLLTKLRGKSNIIQLIDSEVHKQQSLIYMVLEYGDIDLARLLQKQEAARRERAQAQGSSQNSSQMQPADENFIRLYWQQMLQAVDTIHRERIVHSDLKPANFLVVEGQLKLIDFGIAKAIQSDTTSIARESQVGTLNYMSPEAILGGNTSGPRGGPPMKVGRASDIWSLGCIIYQMAYGRTPFAHLPFIQKMHAITNDRHQIEFPLLRNAALLDVIQRCLDRNPRTRITMAELLDHPFLAPTHAATPTAEAGAKDRDGNRIELNEEQLKKLLLRVCQTGGVSDANVDHLSEQLFKQLAQGGSLSPDVVAAKMARREAAALNDENMRPMQLPPS